jgi:hypothetical protein
MGSMNRKIILLVAIMCGQLFIPEAYAETHSSESHCPPIQFYAGMVGGIERMTGRRSEGLTETVGGVSTQFSYTNNIRMLENNAYLSFMGGFLWKLPPLPILIGPELYFGRGNTRSTVTNTTTTNPAVPGQTRLYSTEFARKFFYGGLIRIGYHFCRDYLVSFSLGIDRSQFLTKRYFALDSSVNPTVISRTKGFNGVLFGLALERQFKHFIVGVDFKLIQYRRQQTQDPVPITNSPAVSNFSVRPVLYVAGIRLAYQF